MAARRRRRDAVGVAVLLSLTNAIVAPVRDRRDHRRGALAAGRGGCSAHGCHARPRPRSSSSRSSRSASVFAVLMLGGVASQAGELEGALKSGGGQARRRTLQDAGVSADQAKQANAGVSANLSGAFHALLKGVGTGVKVLGSLAIFLSFTALSLFFLLKDGPQIRRWAERHMGVPHDVGRIDHRAHAAGAARLLHRRHGRRGVQRDRDRPGSARARRRPRRLDRARQLRRRLHPLSRRVVGRRVHRPAGARVAGHHGGADHGGDRPAGQRHPAADDPADRVRRRARASIRWPS